MLYVGAAQEYQPEAVTYWADQREASTHFAMGNIPIAWLHDAQSGVNPCSVRFVRQKSGVRGLLAILQHLYPDHAVGLDVNSEGEATVLCPYSVIPVDLTQEYAEKLGFKAIRSEVVLAWTESRFKPLADWYWQLEYRVLFKWQGITHEPSFWRDFMNENSAMPLSRYVDVDIFRKRGLLESDLRVFAGFGSVMMRGHRQDNILGRLNLGLLATKVNRGDISPTIITHMMEEITSKYHDPRINDQYLSLKLGL